jgi:hypothetical protein
VSPLDVAGPCEKITSMAAPASSRFGTTPPAVSSKARHSTFLPSRFFASGRLTAAVRPPLA